MPDKAGNSIYVSRIAPSFDSEAEPQPGPEYGEEHFPNHCTGERKRSYELKEIEAAERERAARHETRHRLAANVKGILNEYRLEGATFAEHIGMKPGTLWQSFTNPELRTEQWWMDLELALLGMIETVGYQKKQVAPEHQERIDLAAQVQEIMEIHGFENDAFTAEGYTATTIRRALRDAEKWKPRWWRTLLEVVRQKAAQQE